MLARRDLSVEEARARLAASGVAGPKVEDTVRWAVSAGYLDDAKLAAAVVEKELARKPPPAAELIVEKLRGRGIAAEVAAQAVRANADRDTIAARVDGYVRSMRGRIPLARLAGRLARAGHSPETVEALLGAGPNEEIDAEDHDAKDGND